MKTMRVWTKEEPFGTELADISLGDGTLSANGVAIGTYSASQSPRSAYRADYKLTTVERYVTSRLVVRTEGEAFRRSLDLRRLASGTWKCTTEVQGDVALPPPGGDLSALNDALDVDLALSPVTNSMPLLRHRLAEGSAPVELSVAWVSLPDLAVERSLQRYTFVRRDGENTIVRFESLDGDGFTAEITIDGRGLLLDYPGIARHIA
jgi:uncharacterized protein